MIGDKNNFAPRVGIAYFSCFTIVPWRSVCPDILICSLVRDRLRPQMRFAIGTIRFSQTEEAGDVDALAIVLGNAR
jgi:hypothetical protein